MDLPVRPLAMPVLAVPGVACFGDVVGGIVSPSGIFPGFRAFSSKKAGCKGELENLTRGELAVITSPVEATDEMWQRGAGASPVPLPSSQLSGVADGAPE